MKPWILFLCLAAALHGCAAENQTLQTGNPNLTDANIEKVQAGMDSGEVLAILGEPDEKKDLAGGETEWLYRASEGEVNRPGAFSKKSTIIRAKALSVRVNGDGRVIDVTYDEIKETETKRF